MFIKIIESTIEIADYYTICFNNFSVIIIKTNQLLFII